MEPNYSGWAVKSNMKCTDGRIMQPGFAKKQDKTRVPLIYMHNHKDASQILGYAELTHMDEGLWADLFFNGNQKALDTLAAIEHGDIDKLSVWAKELQETVRNDEVLTHDGIVQEVSVVLAGANPGAGLANVLMHSDGAHYDEDTDFAFVAFDLHKSSDLKELKHADDLAKAEAAKPKEPEKAPEETEKTVGDVIKTLNPDQQVAVNTILTDVVTAAVTEALAERESTLQHSDENNTAEEGNNMNLFDKQRNGGQARPELKHDSVRAVLLAAKGNPEDGIRGFREDRAIGSLRDFVRSDAPGQGRELLHADSSMQDYGVQNVEILFPEAQALMAQPTFVDRRQEWVKVWMAGTGKTPFSRIKTMHADITADEARARGYIKGNRKTEEVFPIFKRTTGPAWIYKKQSLDRQDIIDIVDFDVVAWMKVEMRGKLDEEIARAGLFGDNRPIMLANGELNPDKIQEPQGKEGNGIRSVVNDDDLYATTYNVPIPANAPAGPVWNNLLDKAVEANEFYMGGGNKTGFISFRTATRLLTMRDEFNKRVYKNLAEVAGDMEVSQLVRVPTELFPTDVLAIVLDLSDYNYGTNRGGEVTLFDDFDIHFNKFYYLMETYLSGALTMVYAAQIFKRVDPAGTLVEEIPKPVKEENVITVPTVTGIDYRRANDDGTFTALTGGQTIALNDTNTKAVTIEAKPKTGFYFASNSDRKDTFGYRYTKPTTPAAE